MEKSFMLNDLRVILAPFHLQTWTLDQRTTPQLGMVLPSSNKSAISTSTKTMEMIAASFTPGKGDL